MRLIVAVPLIILAIVTCITLAYLIFTSTDGEEDEL